MEWAKTLIIFYPHLSAPWTRSMIFHSAHFHLPSPYYFHKCNMFYTRPVLLSITLRFTPCCTLLSELQHHTPSRLCFLYFIIFPCPFCVQHWKWTCWDFWSSKCNNPPPPYTSVRYKWIQQFLARKLQIIHTLFQPLHLSYNFPLYLYILKIIHERDLFTPPELYRFMFSFFFSFSLYHPHQAHVT